MINIVGQAVLRRLQTTTESDQVESVSDSNNVNKTPN